MAGGNLSSATGWVWLPGGRGLWIPAVVRAVSGEGSGASHLGTAGERRSCHCVLVGCTKTSPITSVEVTSLRLPYLFINCPFFIKPALQDWGSSARGRFEHMWGTPCRPGEMQRGWGTPCVSPSSFLSAPPTLPSLLQHTSGIRICSPSAPDELAEQVLWIILWEKVLEAPFLGAVFKAGGQRDEYNQEREA